MNNAILKRIEETNQARDIGKFSAEGSANLLSEELDRAQLSSKGLRYELLEQPTMDILPGVD